MKVKLTWDSSKVLQQGENFVVVECDEHQSPKLPAYALVEKDTDAETWKNSTGYHLVVSEKGRLKAERYD